MARKRATTEKKESTPVFGVTREQVEQKLQEAYESKVRYFKMIDMLDGAIQTMEFILNGLDETDDGIAK